MTYFSIIPLDEHNLTIPVDQYQCYATKVGSGRLETPAIKNCLDAFPTSVCLVILGQNVGKRELIPVSYKLVEATLRVSPQEKVFELLSVI